MIGKDDNNSKQISRFDKIINKMKSISISIVCVTIVVGSIAAYIASVCSDNVTIDTLSGFIGIVLGVVALTTSIVSMVVSFYSIEKSDESTKELNALLQEIKYIQTNTEKLVAKIDENQGKIANMFTNSGANTQTKDVKQNPNQDWCKVNKDED